jgi:hypothetical protein
VENVKTGTTQPQRTRGRHLTNWLLRNIALFADLIQSIKKQSRSNSVRVFTCRTTYVPLQGF